MKNTLLIATALTALSVSALAADLPARTLAPVASAPIFSWTGFYIGGTVGSLMASVKSTSVYTGSGYSWAKTSNGPAPSATLAAAVGYNHQFGNIVVGLEADYNFANAIQNKSFNNFMGPSSLLTTTLGSFGTFRGRVGYAIDRTLIFATAGVAVAHISGSADHGDDASFNKFTLGWVTGGGVENALTNTLTLKAEALYADFGSPSGINVYVGSSPPSSIRTTDFKSKTSAVTGRMGMNFKF